MNVIFAGTPEIAAIIFEKLLDSGHRIIAAYTQPDRRAGRGRQLTPSPVKQLAMQHHIPVYQPLSLKNAEAQAELAALQPDLMIVVAYGLILPQAVLDIPKFGCWNVHVSLLPRWRGAAPIQRAIEAGDKETGVTIMQMDAGLDTGAMLRVAKCPISVSDTAASLHDHLARLGAETLLATLQDLHNGKLQANPQSGEGVTYAHKISKEEARLNWQSSAEEIVCKIHAFNSWPVAQSQLDGQIVRIWQAVVVNNTVEQAPGTLVAVSKDGLDVATGKGLVRITQLQFPGGKVLAVRDILNARQHPLQAGKVLQ